MLLYTNSKVNRSKRKESLNDILSKIGDGLSDEFKEECEKKYQEYLTDLRKHYLPDKYKQ